MTRVIKSLYSHAIVVSASQRTSSIFSGLGLALSVAAFAVESHAQQTLRKGPWLMDTRGTEITVMAERASPGPLSVTVTLEEPPLVTVARDAGVADAALDAAIARRDAGLNTGLDAGLAPSSWTEHSVSDATFHELTIRGLIAGRRYRYEVSAPGLEPSGGHFATAPEAFSPFRFVVYGDTRSSSGAHAAIVGQLVTEGADWALHTGDLVEDGRDEELWQEFFDIERPLLRMTPWVPVIGNHEIVSPGTSGVDRYRRYVHLEPSSPSPELHYEYHWGNVHLVLVNGYDDFNDPEPRQWLTSRLASARASADRDHGWVLFATHWGPRSSGPHGDNRPFRSANVDTLLRRYHVDLSISGHDHLYERGDDNGLRFIVSGGGGAGLYRQRSTNDFSRKIVIAHHYVRMDVREDSILATVIRDNGTVLESCALFHDRWGCDDRVQPLGQPPPTLTTPPSAPPAPPQKNCGCRMVAVPESGPPNGLSRLLTFAIGLAFTRVFARSNSRRAQ